MGLGLTTKTLTGDKAFLDGTWLRYISVGVTMDKTTIENADANDYKIFYAGSVIGKITASGKWRRCTLATTSALAASGQKDIVITEDTARFKVGDSIIAGTAAANVIASIVVATKTITLTDNLNVQVAKGAVVKGTDGSEVALCLLMSEIDVTKLDGAGSAADRARVIEARLPYLVTAKEKEHLATKIDFV